MSKKVLTRFVALLSGVTLVAIVALSGFGLAAQNARPTLVVQPVVRGGTSMVMQYNGPAVSNVEFSPDGGQSWRTVEYSGVNELSFSAPAIDTNSAQVRLTLSDAENSRIQSDLFAIDSTAPTTTVLGRPFTENGRLRMDFSVIGADVASLKLRAENEGGTALDLPPITPQEARQQGFPLLADGSYSLTLIATDRVGNVERKIQPDVTGFVVDATPPEVSVSLGFEGRAQVYALGGEGLSLSYSVDDANLDLTSLKFELIANGKVRALIDPNLTQRQGNFIWNVPREDHARAHIQLSAIDRAGNIARSQTQSFPMFAGVPEATIVNEASGGEDKVTFTIDYIHRDGLEALRQMGLDYAVHIYVGGWDDTQKRYLWDLDKVHRDTQFTNPVTRDTIEISSIRNNRAFVARLVVGDGNNPITERVPDAETQPESIFQGLDRIHRITLQDLPEDRRIYQAGKPITIRYDISGQIGRGAELLLEYSDDGGKSWLPINRTPITVNRDGDSGAYEWEQPPSNLSYAVIRAITQYRQDGLVYRVQDLMDGGLIIDGEAPKSRIVRVTDHNGRALQSGDYTNTPELRFEWRATDPGGAGLANLVLWDNSQSAKLGTSAAIWSDREFYANTIDPSEAPRRIDPVMPNYVLTYGRQPRPIGKLGFVMEAIDRAGNRQFPSGRPGAEQASLFEVNIDLIPPVVAFTDKPVSGTIRPGETLSFAWRAQDNLWNGVVSTLLKDSMDTNPVSIHAVDKDGNRNTLQTNLPTVGTATIMIPATMSGMDVKFLITARDRAGNESNPLAEDALTPTISIRNIEVPDVELRSVKLEEGTNSLAFTWEMRRGVREELSFLTLWVRPKGQEWSSYGQFAPDQPITFGLPNRDIDYEFSLVATDINNLSESGQRLPEQSYQHDVEAPRITVEIDPPRSVFTLEADPAARTHPTPRVTVTDLHLDPSGVIVTVERSGAGEESLRMDTGPFESGVEKILDPILLRRAEVIRVVVKARDLMGHESEESVSFRVADAPQWTLIGGGQGTVFYVNIPRPVHWTSNVPFDPQRTVDLYIQPVEITEDGFRYGDKRVVAQGIPDTGRYQIPRTLEARRALNQPEGLYRYVLEAISPDGQRRVTTSPAPFSLRTPRPLARIADPRSAALHTTGELILRGTIPHPLVMVLEDAGGGPYPFPSDRISLRIRYSKINDVPESGVWEVREFPVQSLPDSLNRPLEFGEYGAVLTPAFGEGRYEVVPQFTDIFGIKAEVAEGGGKTFIIDAGPPKVRLRTLLENRRFYTADEVDSLIFEVSDPLLDPSSIRFEFRENAEEPWQRLPEVSRTFETQTATSSSGRIRPDFSRAGRYFVRLVAEDVLGQSNVDAATGRVNPEAMLNGPIYAGEANYEARRVIEVENAPDVYTSSAVAQRSEFRIVVDPVNPWPEDEGLGDVILWWRLNDGVSGPKPAWNKLEINDRWLVGRLEADWLIPGFENHENAIPFKAEESGYYEFIITTISRFGQKEGPNPPSPNSRPELGFQVFVEGFQLNLNMPEASDGLELEQIESLKTGRVQQLETYALSWTLTLPSTQTNYIDLTTFNLEFFDGERWRQVETLKPVRDPNDPPGELVYTERKWPKTRGTRSYQEIYYRCLWTCPPVVVDLEEFRARLRLTARIQSNTMPNLKRTSYSPYFKIGEPRPGLSYSTIDYYRRKIEDGRTHFEGREFNEALKHFLDARAERDTIEANAWLAKTYRVLGDHDKADHHQAHTQRAGLQTNGN